MQKNVSSKSKILLVCSIVLAVFFSTIILLDYLNIELTIIGVIWELLILPSLLGIIALPVIIVISMIKDKNKNRKQLTYAAIITGATLFLVFYKFA